MSFLEDYLKTLKSEPRLEKTSGLRKDNELTINQLCENRTIKGVEMSEDQVQETTETPETQETPVQE